MVPLAAALMATAGAGFWLGRLGSESVSPTYRPLTFRRGILTAARFSPDGGQFLYSAAWDGGPSQLYAVRPDVRGEQTLDVPGRLAGAAFGELVAVRPDRVLLRAPLSGGTAREAVENVRLADLSRDGTRLAIVRLADGRDRIESPPGTVVYATTGEILLLRFAPDDRRLAFVERPNSGFNPARVGVVEPGGQPRLLTPEHYIISLAWSPDGDEIWFSSVRGPGGNELRAVSMSGKDRVLLRTAQWPMIHDVRPDGRALLELRDMRYEVVGRGAGGSEERTLSWDEDPEAYDVSADGRTFTFAVAGTAASQGGVGTGAGRDRVVTATVTAYLGRMDGGPPVRLGDGLPTGMSPDGRWVATISKQGRTLTLLPTGAGEPRHPPPGTLRYYYDVRYFADGQSILISGNEEGRPRRLFRQDLAGGVPHAVTPEGIETEYPIPSPDGRWVAAGPNWREAPYALYPLDGGEPRSVPGLDKGEQPLRFDASGQRLFVRSGNIPVRVFLLDLATGRREPWREIGPADRAGWLGLSWIYPTADGRSYMYQYRRILSTLYLVEGLR